MIAAGCRLAAAVGTVVLVLVTGTSPAAADAIRDQQWHLGALRIPEAHRLSEGGGVVVAVTDTGVDPRAAELSGAVLPGKDFGEGANGDGRFDPIGHGTAMAGLIAGRGLPDGAGVLGIAPKAMILPVQTLQGDLGVPANLADGIDWAVGQGAKVICIAGGTSEDPAVKRAVERALAADVVVVAGVGNRPKTTSVAFPAKLPGVLAVGGSDRDGKPAAVSVAGPETVVVAPAVDIVSTSLAGKYAVGTGTSDATAIVAGVVALVRAKYPALSGTEVVRRIALTASDRGKPGRDDEYGFGLVDPVAALTAEVPSPAPGMTTRGPGVPRAGVSAGAVVWVGAVGVAIVALVWWRRRR